MKNEKMQKSAFSIFSFCVYLMVATVVISTVLPIFFHLSIFITTMTQKQRMQQEISRTLTIVAGIMKEINPQQLIVYQGNTIIWQESDKTKAIAFERQKNKLYFIEGFYDQEMKIWKKRKKALISYLISMTFLYHETPIPHIILTAADKDLETSMIITPFLKTYTISQGVVS